MERGAPSGETGHREVEAAPKEMNGARLAQEAGSKKLEYAIDLDKHTPKAMGGGGVVRGVGQILRKWDRVGYLIRHLVDRDPDLDAVQEIDDATIEFGNGLRLQRQLAPSPRLVRAMRRWLMKSNSISRIS